MTDIADAAATFRQTVATLDPRAAIALYAFAAELALETLPPGDWRDDGQWANSLAVRVAAGETVEPTALVAALEDADAGNKGPLFYQSETEGTEAENVWGAAVSPLAFAAYTIAIRRGERPYEIVENVDEVDLPDITANYLRGIRALDADALRSACTHLAQARAAAPNDKWDHPVDMPDLRRAAGRPPEGPHVDARSLTRPHAA